MSLSQADIVNKLLEAKPLSIMRLGDGEALCLNAASSYSALKRASDAVIKRQLGFEPTIKQVEEIRQNLIDAYTGADIIGVPMQKNLANLSKNWTEAEGILKENVPNCTSQICSIDVAYDMLHDGSYDKLLQNRHVLNYISCRDLDEGFKRKWNIKTVNQYLIAPEAKWTSGYEGPPHYPDQFNKIPRWMEVVSERHPGSLLLVGAGVIGKIYCKWWRDRGGVAMDAGGVFDIWFGKVTRGPERGLDKDDPNPIHKL